MHAKIFNIIARAFGVMCIIGGLVFTKEGLSLVLNRNATFNVDGVPTDDPWIKGSVLVIGIGAFVAGVLIFKARPYKSPYE